MELLSPTLSLECELELYNKETIMGKKFLDVKDDEINAWITVMQLAENVGAEVVSDKTAKWSIHEAIEKTSGSYENSISWVTEVMKLAVQYELEKRLEELPTPTLDESVREIVATAKKESVPQKALWCFALNNGELFKHLHKDAVMKFTAMIQGLNMAIESGEIDPTDEEVYKMLENVPL